MTERSSDNAKRRLREPAPALEVRQDLASRARFEGSSKHKHRPRAFGLVPVASDEDDTYCDGHAGFAPTDLARIPSLLSRGLLAGLISQYEKHGDPTMIWTVDDNGWIYEGRITIPGQTLYHGYPLLPVDAFAKIVIARYTDWVYDQNNSDLLGSLQKALDLYP